MDKDGVNVCRVCLRKDIGSMKCLSLFESYEDSSVSEHIACLARVKIREGDGLPDKICPECLLQLSTAIAFKRKCQTSDNLLQSQLKKNPAITQVFEVSIKKEDLTELYDASHDLFDEQSDTLKKERKYRGKTTTSLKLIDLKEINKNKTKRHKKEQNDTDLKFICDDCSEHFKSKCKLRAHWKKFHLPDKLICPDCKRTFKSFKSLHTHINKKLRSCRMAASNIHIDGHGKSRLFHCKYCLFKSKTLKIMVAHLVIHTGEKRYQCKDCPKSYTQPASLQSHREFRHKEYLTETTCHVCGKLLRGREAAYKHIRTHTPKSVQCKICNKVLKSRPILIIHMKRHSGIKSSACESCGATFYTSGELDVHMKRVHLKSQAFKCDMCDYSTFNVYYLNKHKSKHTGSNIPCLICGTFLDDIEKYVAHQKKHSEKNYGCPQCDKKYSTKHSLAKHVRLKHKHKSLSNESEKVAQ